MRIALWLAFLMLHTVGVAWAQMDPCANYRSVLAYSRTADSSPVNLVLTEAKTGAEIELRVALNYTAIQGNLTDGAQCKIALELMWPQMTAGGLTDEQGRRVKDRMIGDMPAWRALTIDVGIEHKAWARWMIPGGYCRTRMKRTELTDRPFGLRAFDDGIAWPRHRQRDGSYRSVQELLPYPLNAANQFFFIDGDGDEMVRISCSKGAPRCQMHDHIGTLQTTILFNADDLANWRNYRDAVRQFLTAHSVRAKAGTLLETGRHIDPAAEYMACMQSMTDVIGADTLRGMGLGKGLGR
jgi:hypothetical protein